MVRPEAKITEICSTMRRWADNQNAEKFSKAKKASESRSLLEGETRSPDYQNMLNHATANWRSDIKKQISKPNKYSPDKTIDHAWYRTWDWSSLIVVNNEKHCKVNKLSLFVNSLVTMASNHKAWHTMFTKETCGAFTRMEDLWEELLLLDCQVGEHEESRQLRPGECLLRQHQ